MGQVTAVADCDFLVGAYFIKEAHIVERALKCLGWIQPASDDVLIIAEYQYATTADGAAGLVAGE